MMASEVDRIKEDSSRDANWKRWGPYLSERQWATVREDYSADGSCWDSFPHDYARSRAYRWGEDGLLGITDRECRLCMAFGFWNERDPIIKERLFGLTGSEGNHGEDVKECYYYLDSTPTHSYMKSLYKYPQREYPYEGLLSGNRNRGPNEPELELEEIDGMFNDGCYWDISVEYAKAGPNDILCRLTVHNRGPNRAVLHVLPTLWFRNTWIWGCTHEGCTMKPKLREIAAGKVYTKHDTLGEVYWEVDICPTAKTIPEFLFTENETNTKLLYDIDNYTPFTRDAFHRYLVKGEVNAINPDKRGTRVAAHYQLTVNAGEAQEIRLRLYHHDEAPSVTFGKAFDDIFACRLREANEFYEKVILNDDANEKQVVRQAYAGLLWSKQFYHYVVKDWIEGDPDMPVPPQERLNGRNAEWKHLFNRDVISMPDKWEYPWYASWDLAFHMVTMAEVDIEFAKEQLIMFLREWYMHPNGQIPAYEFAFGDVNPPVHALAVWYVYCSTGDSTETRDHLFLARCFQKLILNFTWWVNRKDPQGKNIFGGGFLGLDNIGVFDRSRPLPVGGELHQADGTAWMAFFSVCMLCIAIELADTDPVYEDMASKYFEHFLSIVDAINSADGEGLWNAEDSFYYDHLKMADNQVIPLKIRSLVGLVPLFSCLVLEQNQLQKLTGFCKRTKWFLENREDLASRMSFMKSEEKGARLLLAVPTREQLEAVLKYVLDENEFLSPYGIRSLSKVHQDKPFVLYMNGEEYRIDYLPGESNSGMFGGNSNWRGPIWLCMNFILIEVLKRYHYYYEDDLKVECPTGSGQMMNLREVSFELSHRLAKLFLPDATGHRPCHGENDLYANDPHWKDLILFYEYFHADTGRGCGASHQTGWTALVATCLRDIAKNEKK